MGFTCWDCNNLNKNDRNSYGEYRCHGWNAYVRSDKVANHCKKFWAIVTTTCNVLKLNKTNPTIFNDSQKLKINYLNKSIDWDYFVDDYQNFGYVVAEKLSKDKKSKYISNYILNHCLKPVITEIKKGNYEEAANIFQDMFYGLADYYNVEITDKPLTKKKIEYCFYE